MRGIANGRGGDILINGNFDYWQRGTSLHDRGYLADRWCGEHNQGGLSQERSEDVPNSQCKHSLLITKTLGNGYGPYVFQKMERPELYHDITMTWSAWIKADPGASVEIYLSGGHRSMQEDIIGDGQWHKYSSTGACQVTQNFFNFYVRYKDGSPAGARIWVAQAKLEQGDRAAPFVPRLPGEELALCQRYYEKSYAPDDAPGAVILNGSEMAVSNGATAGIAYDRLSFNIRFRVQKRINPTVYTYSSNGVINSISKVSSIGYIASAILGRSHNSMHISAATASEVVANSLYAVHWVADAEL